MATEQPHAAFARHKEQIDVVVIDDSKPMQSILRSMLHAIKVARIRTYDGAQAAMDSMLVDPPQLIIVDWLMEPIDGLSMLKAMRTRRMGQLAVVPAIILTSTPTVKLVESSVKVGAHAVLAKPLSPMLLQKRIEAILHDKRGFVLDEETGTWMLSGATELLEAQQNRQKQYRQVRNQYIEVVKREAAALPPEPKPVPQSVAPQVQQPPQPHKAAGFGAPGKIPPKPRDPTRKAIGIGGRRADPQAMPTSGA